MSSFAIALKAEIARVARKELKGELLAIRKIAASHRTEISALKRDLKALRSQLKSNQRSLKFGPPAAPRELRENRSRAERFSAEAFAAKRAKLGLTQLQMARLLEASALSVYKWESGSVQPRAAQIARILAVQKMGKREASARLGERADR
jgi:DNA-binding transcriptional regulator YiaG